MSETRLDKLRIFYNTPSFLGGNHKLNCIKIEELYKLFTYSKTAQLKNKNGFIISKLQEIEKLGKKGQKNIQINEIVSIRNEEIIPDWWLASLKFANDEEKQSECEEESENEIKLTEEDIELFETFLNLKSEHDLIKQFEESNQTKYLKKFHMFLEQKQHA